MEFTAGLLLDMRGRLLYLQIKYSLMYCLLAMGSYSQEGSLQPFARLTSHKEILRIKKTHKQT